MSDILCAITRSGQIESFHVAHGVIVKPNGDIVVAYGNANLETYARSSAKPFQAMALYRSGAVDKYGLDAKDIAIVCSSHSGQDMHTEAVESLFTKINLNSDLLKCGTHPPLHRPSAKKLTIAGQDPTELHNNCSGKHAGMLAVSQHMGNRLDTYLEEGNPTQSLIYDILCEYTGREVIHRGVDGCSAPVFFISLKELAVAFAKLMQQDDDETKLIAQSMMEYPELIGGEKRFDTLFMEAMKGSVISKGGAEGVTATGIRLANGDVWGVAIKVLDGHHRAVGPAMISLLQSAGAFTPKEIEKLKDIQEPVLKNHAGIEIGRIQTIMNKKG